jgi:hypothetical protein
MADILNVIWKDMISSPYICALGVFIIVIVLFRKVIIDYLENKMLTKKYFTPAHKIKDLKKHPIFLDLDYWTSVGISILHVNTCLGKEMIMKDLLLLKYTLVKERIMKVIDNEITDTMSLEDLRLVLMANLSEYNRDQALLWKTAGIPDAFVRKYVSLQIKNIDLIKGVMKVLLDKNIIASNSVRVYLLLSLLRNQLTSIYTNAVSTVLAMNGDLNGLIYKGVEIQSHFVKEEEHE